MVNPGQVTLPPTRPLKRSSSTASLPTPPRTQHRRKIGRAKGGPKAKVVSDEDSDTGDGNVSTDEEDNGRRRKRRRISAIQEEAEEEAFWAGGQEISKSSRLESQTTMSEPEIGTTAHESDQDAGSTSDVPFLSRRRMKMATGSAPVSPPPSHRRKKPAKTVSLKLKAGPLFAVSEEDPVKPATSENVSPATVASTPPRTPKSQVSKGAGISPILLRDSPNNPFLSSPESPSDAARSGRVIQGSTVDDERPTFTMVRGVRKEFPNPYYDHKNGRPKSPDPRSLLPPEHPDYTPDLRSRPRALWPSKKKASAPAEEPPTPTKSKAKADKVPTALLRTPPLTMKREAKAKTKTALVESDDEDDVLAEESIMPIRPLRLFGENKS
uniref:Uncharacterized protein n=1 Tax=Moniliophthora roreri TaxID=221103 RepID=A0A0W0FX86_MONRR